MSRADRKRRRRASGLLRTPAERRTVLAAIRAGVCPCETDVDNPGPHLVTCPWSDPDYGELPF